MSGVAPNHPNRFTFGGVIAERVNTVETHRKVGLFPIFGRSLPSSRIISLSLTETEIENEICYDEYSNVVFILHSVELLLV